MAQASDFRDFGWQLSIDFPQRTEKQSPGLPIWKAGAVFMWFSGLLGRGLGVVGRAPSLQCNVAAVRLMPAGAPRRPQERF
jgi:hypothetical protein